MANTSIPNLPPVLALAGQEQIEVVQNGVSSRATVAQVAQSTQGVIYTISTLPTPIAGSRAFVSNGAPVFAGVVGAAGSVFSPIYGDGTVWRYG